MGCGALPGCSGARKGERMMGTPRPPGTLELSSTGLELACLVPMVLAGSQGRALCAPAKDRLTLSGYSHQ